MLSGTATPSSSFQAELSPSMIARLLTRAKTMGSLNRLPRPLTEEQTSRQVAYRADVHSRQRRSAEELSPLRKSAGCVNNTAGWPKPHVKMLLVTSSLFKGVKVQAIPVEASPPSSAKAAPSVPSSLVARRLLLGKGTGSSHRASRRPKPPSGLRIEIPMPELKKVETSNKEGGQRTKGGKPVGYSEQHHLTAIRLQHASLCKAQEADDGAAIAHDAQSDDHPASHHRQVAIHIERICCLSAAHPGSPVSQPELQSLAPVIAEILCHASRMFSLKQAVTEPLQGQQPRHPAEPRGDRRRQRSNQQGLCID
jgi:hypothetical protein